MNRQSPKARRSQEHLCSSVTIAALFFVLFVVGCATPTPSVTRRFDFRTDTFAYENELKWEYDFDANGKWTGKRRDSETKYSLHCFVVARSARQFFANARFDPSKPVVNKGTYRKLVRRVARSDPRQPFPEEKKIVIPGYANLREFSEAKQDLLRAECGPATQSYFQRGNWRMIFPFKREGQAKVAEELKTSLQRNWPPIVHAVTFPNLILNHAVLIFDAKEEGMKTFFSAYDPNDSSAPITIKFDSASKQFFFPKTKYFPGGKVNIYEIYRSWNY
jgi:hypothetical protein